MDAVLERIVNLVEERIPGFYDRHTENLRDGSNTLLVSCRNDAPNSRWYSERSIECLANIG